MFSSQTLPFFRRLGGLQIVQTLVKRANEMNLVQDAVVPYKEDFVRMARKSLSDNESSVTAIASGILQELAGWP